MKKWLYDRPWIWIVVLLTLLVGGGLFVVALAEINKPTIVKEAAVDVEQLAPGADRFRAGTGEVSL
ncbi:MAG: hypothetical protein GY780_06835 [bacterium]|nr:hypothetical protein [bacterium]